MSSLLARSRTWPLVFTLSRNALRWRRAGELPLPLLQLHEIDTKSMKEMTAWFCFFHLSIDWTSSSWPASGLSFWWFLNVSATSQERGTFRPLMCNVQNLSKWTAPLTSLSTAEALPVFDVLLLLLYKLCLLLHETHLDRFVPRWFEFIWLWLTVTVCFGDLSTRADRGKTTPTDACHGLDCTLRRRVRLAD